MRTFRSVLRLSLCVETFTKPVVGEAPPLGFVPCKRDLGFGESKHTLHRPLLPPLMVSMCAHM